ncbi:hypothetical protein AOLI_G00065960 [Acnodon oligacanthus]
MLVRLKTSSALEVCRRQLDSSDSPSWTLLCSPLCPPAVCSTCWVVTPQTQPSQLLPGSTLQLQSDALLAFGLWFPPLAPETAPQSLRVSSRKHAELQQVAHGPRLAASCGDSQEDPGEQRFPELSEKPALSGGGQRWSGDCSLRPRDRSKGQKVSRCAQSHVFPRLLSCALSVCGDYEVSTRRAGVSGPGYLCGEERLRAHLTEQLLHSVSICC